MVTQYRFPTKVGATGALNGKVESTQVDETDESCARPESLQGGMALERFAILLDRGYHKLFMSFTLLGIRKASVHV